MSVRFFADHCVANSVVAELTKAGHQVHELRDHLPTDAADQVVIQMAQSLDAVLLSLNGDFADIVSYPPADYKGIVALRVRNHPETLPQAVKKLLEYLNDHPDAEHYVGKLFLVEPHQIRTRGA